MHSHHTYVFSSNISESCEPKGANEYGCSLVAAATLKLENKDQIPCRHWSVVIWTLE
jgi:hypothetical protein